MIAYLALTSKPENQIRDRLAFDIQNKLPNHFVSREWKNRTDLAILKDNSPIVLCELKYAYSFDFTESSPNPLGYIEIVKRDIEKMNKFAKDFRNNTEINQFCLLLVTHPETTIKKDYPDNIIKYEYGMNKALKKFGNSKSLMNKCSETVTKYLDVKDHGRLGGGEYKGTKVSVYYWLV